MTSAPASPYRRRPPTTEEATAQVQRTIADATRAPDWRQRACDLARRITQEELLEGHRLYAHLAALNAGWLDVERTVEVASVYPELEDTDIIEAIFLRMETDRDAPAAGNQADYDPANAIEICDDEAGWWTSLLVLDGVEPSRWPIVLTRAHEAASEVIAIDLDHHLHELLCTEEAGSLCSDEEAEARAIANAMSSLFGIDRERAVQSWVAGNQDVYRHRNEPPDGPTEDAIRALGEEVARELHQGAVDDYERRLERPDLSFYIDPDLLRPLEGLIVKESELAT